MKRIGVGVAVALVLAAAVTAWLVSRPPARRSAGDLQLHRLAPDVYVYRGVFSASGVLVLPKGVVIVDTQVAPMAAERLRQEIARVTPLPITHVINTHYHGDHVGGNASFPEAEIISTEDTARYVVERDSERVEYADTFGLAFQRVHAVKPPTRTFRGRLELDIGGEKIEVLQLGRVETPDACIVWWPSRRVVFTGDGVATVDFPWTGVPFLDEGLQPDGEWIQFLERVKELRPVLLVPGHGPPIAGEREIVDRLDLLASLFRDLFAVTREELERGGPVSDVVARVDARLRPRYDRDDLEERVVSLRFAIFKAINGLSPERHGKGWWYDLRPSIIARASPERAARELGGRDGVAVRARAAELADKDRGLAIAMLEGWISEHPDDAAALGLLSDVLLDGMVGVTPYVDATEYFAASTRAARRALAINTKETLAVLNLGASEVWGGMVLAQPMGPAIEKLKTALAAGGLTAWQRRKASFFLGKAYQMEGDHAASDHWYRQLLPGPLRFTYPLVRERLRATP